RCTTITPRGWRYRIPIRTRADATDCLVDALAADWGVRDSPGPARRSGGVHDGAPFHRPRRGQQLWRSVDRTVGPEATPRALRTWAWRYYGCSPSGALTAFEGETVVAQGIGGEGSRRAGAVCRQFRHPVRPGAAGPRLREPSRPSRRLARLPRTCTGTVGDRTRQGWPGGARRQDSRPR